MNCEVWLPGVCVYAGALAWCREPRVRVRALVPPIFLNTYLGSLLQGKDRRRLEAQVDLKVLEMKKTRGYCYIRGVNPVHY